MDNQGLFNLLEKTFIDTFLKELLPGIFHNLANPLNGIMGRSRLMQRRLYDFVKKIENRYPDIEEALGADYRKLMTDIDSINNETERFFEMFRVSTEKFDAIGTNHADAAESFNLSSLIEAELGFADFYLDFKHNIKKEIRLDRELPEISGIVSFYSMAIWILLRQAMMNRLDRNSNVFQIATNHDREWVYLRVTYPGSGIFQEWRPFQATTETGFGALATGTAANGNLIQALQLLQLSSPGVEINTDGATDLLTVRIPSHREERRTQNLW